MLQRLFGRSNATAEKRALEKQLGYGNVRSAQIYLEGCSVAFLRALDDDEMVKQCAADSNMHDSDLEGIKMAVVRLMMGPVPATHDFPLTPSQATAVQMLYDKIRLSRYGESYAGGMAMALANAATAWCAGQHELSEAIATHVIDEIAPNAGEAYRIRGMARISLGRFDEAAQDLRIAVASIPKPLFAEEGLALVERFLHPTI